MRLGKAGEIVAEGENIRRGSWRAEQESEGISRDGEIDEDTKELCCHAMNKTGLSGLSGLSRLSGLFGLFGLSGWSSSTKHTRQTEQAK